MFKNYDGYLSINGIDKTVFYHEIDYDFEKYPVFTWDEEFYHENYPKQNKAEFYLKYGKIFYLDFDSLDNIKEFCKIVNFTPKSKIEQLNYKGMVHSLNRIKDYKQKLKHETDEDIKKRWQYLLDVSTNDFKSHRQKYKQNIKERYELFQEKFDFLYLHHLFNKYENLPKTMIKNGFDYLVYEEFDENVIMSLKPSNIEHIILR